MRVSREDVLAPGGPSPDLILAQNFSYFIFAERETLKAYFTNCRRSLRRGGVLALDIFGGPGTFTRNVERTDYKSFTFWWEQSELDPVTHTARCAIHFKPKGRRKVRDAFTYEWRMWSIPEVRELLREAGFRKSHVYWEGGDGRPVESVWLALILAEK